MTRYHSASVPGKLQMGSLESGVCVCVCVIRVSPAQVPAPDQPSSLSCGADPSMSTLVWVIRQTGAATPTLVL